MGLIIMIILGIDPGTVSVGYAIIEGGGRDPLILDAGLIKINPLSDNAGRLRELAGGVKNLIKKWKPAVLSIERLFFYKNQKTALSVAEARGAILLTTSLAGLIVYEYTPLEIKKAVTGNGKADKSQLKKMVQLTIPSSRNLEARDDVFDAIGAALTYFFLARVELKHTPPVK